ncbi:AzlD domain-containing protein [Nocardia concava]|uniref:AzlD domain-containing protein n=1 Tax=Nocardia concava TaxID=257281 RepID=UPI0002FEE8DB|nr:AzlD domain-containing protein [Nocardia concava]
MSTTALIAVLVGMTAVTYGIRSLPLLLADRFTISESVLHWMAYVPPAVLAALIAPSVFVPDAESHALNLDWANPLFLTALPTLLVAWRTKNMYATVGTGVVVLALLRLAGL